MKNWLSFLSSILILLLCGFFVFAGLTILALTLSGSSEGVLSILTFGETIILLMILGITIFSIYVFYKTLRLAINDIKEMEQADNARGSFYALMITLVLCILVYYSLGFFGFW